MNRKSSFSRRDFLQAGLIGGAGAALLGPSILGGIAVAAESSDGVCLTICNHWSYIGIGWQLGVESCVLSVTDGMELADRPPHAKTCINLDARAYEFIAEKFPEVIKRLKKYLKEGKVELIGGTYGQPMGTMFGGESNIRQVVVGRELIRKVLDYELVTFLEEEEFTHPQIPQIAAGAGFRYASLAQLDTWGRAGCPTLDLNALNWKGIDGTTIPTIPKNALFGFGPEQMKQLVDTPAFKKLRALGKPLLFAWEEFGWESPEQPAYLSSPARYKQVSDKWPVEFVTCKDYLDKYGSQIKQTVFLPMDAWDKSLTWGLGGDQLRVMDRKVEGLLLAAERFDAIASTLGMPSQVALLEKAWLDLLASQSHDVGLCESSRWQGDMMAPYERIEDKHNFTWGAIGYNHLDAAEKQGNTALDATLAYVAGQINSAENKQGAKAVTVFNPCAWQRDDVLRTGRIYPMPEAAADVVVKDRAGRVVPSQIVKADRDPQGNLVVADVAFPAAKTPSVGYDTYYLEFVPKAAKPKPTDLRIDEPGLTLENEFLKVRLDPTTGGIAGLVDKRSGREMLDSKLGAFPHFTGRPNPNLSLTPEPPAMYDSAKSKAAIDWLQKGPLLATVRAQHSWKYMRFETRVTLTAGRPYIEVVTRTFTKVPPHSDAWPPANIKAGYWMAFKPAFEIARVVRDYPLAVDTTEKKQFHALTFADFVGKDTGLLVLHPGTQWFSRNENGEIANLLMREWESHFTKEYGWPLYCEYRHALMPHDGRLTNAQRLQASAAFAYPLIARVGDCHSGPLPATKGFVNVAPEAVQLTALRKRPSGQTEVRVVETEGQKTKASVELGFPFDTQHETSLLGSKIGKVDRDGDNLVFDVDPWKIRTFQLSGK
jgi:alpha-mannosidase